MFFMIGITDGRKELSFSQMVVCKTCGAYSRFSMFVTFTQLLLFFIPCFKWNRHYYVQMRCCGAVYELDPEIGRRIESGETPFIKEEDLTLVSAGNRTKIRSCASCGYTTSEDFSFCPKCGRPL